MTKIYTVNVVTDTVAAERGVAGAGTVSLGGSIG